MRVQKMVLVVFGLLMIASPATAFDCPFGEEGHLLPVRWSVESVGGVTNVRVGVQNTFAKQVRMVDAGVWFIDGLDRSVIDQAIAIDPDLRILANGANISQVSTTGVDRLLRASVEDFTPHICTRAILFEDGSKLNFPR